MSSRSPRTTKQQKLFMLNFIEENKILLGGKVNPLLLPKINKLWETLTIQLNQTGSPKTTRQWKDTFSEMKTNARRHARDLKYGQTGTGGGGAVKSLTDFEERLLALISVLNIEGVELPEAGCSENVTAKSEEENQIYELDDIIVIGNEVMLEPDEPQNNLIVEETYVDENTLPTSCNSTRRIPAATPNRSRTRKTIKRTGRGRVEMALATHDQNLRDLTNSNLAIAKSINTLAKALNSIAKKMR